MRIKVQGKFEEKDENEDGGSIHNNNWCGRKVAGALEALYLLLT